MKRITTNDDIRFPIRVVRGLDSDVFTIQFYTTSKAVNITKTNEDVVDGIIHLEWTELYPLGTGVLNYTVLVPEADGSYSDDTFNMSISGTTVFYIVSNIIVPDGDDAQNLIDIVAELDGKLDAEIARSTGKDNAHDTALADVYTKGETNTLLAGKANKNGSTSEYFAADSIGLRRDNGSTTLYNYTVNGSNHVSFYDQSGGELTYKFTANQADNIATERQLNTKANSSDVYTKAEVETLIDEHVPDLPDNVVTDANYVHTDNNFTTTLKNKLDGIASGAEVNVQANWNETNSSSDAYIQNKPTIPTVDSSITGSSQTNAVQGGAIYTALAGKAGYKYYSYYDDMVADNPANGTICFDGDEEVFYVYNSPSGEWYKIDNDPIVNSITSGSPYPVQGGTIYTALAGKAGYRYYNSYNSMTADNPANGTIGFDGDNEYFYIYDSGNREWYKIDNDPIVNSITSGSTSPVQGGTIYTALSGKAGYRWYSDYNSMIADTPANGTIGFDSDNEEFYIFDSGNLEWRRIDGGGGGSNVQADWNETDSTSDAYILNKPQNLVQDANYVHTDNNFTTSYKTTLDNLATSITIDNLTVNEKTNTKEVVLTPFYTVPTEVPADNQIGFNAAYDNDNDYAKLELYDYHNTASTFIPIIDGATFITTAGFPVEDIDTSGSSINQNSPLKACTYNNLVVRNVRVRNLNLLYSMGNTSYILLIDKSNLQGLTTINFPGTTTWKGGTAFDLSAFIAGSDSYAIINLLQISSGVVLASYETY